ncbi:MAG: hypothetical protein DRJ03_11635 [Chloroflexi bacterium]|nr:MAG: hypothetical protein DRJ03_11635 [Chloroflexota bacterium]
MNETKGQLPTGMEECTILFIECEKGHGRLTATNWIDHGCSTCQLEKFEKEIAELKERLGMVEEWSENCHASNLSGEMDSLRALLLGGE